MSIKSTKGHLHQNRSFSKPEEYYSAGSLFQLLSHQTEYIDQLEKDITIIQGELRKFKQRLVEVVDENQSLYDEIGSKITHHTLSQSHNILNGTGRSGNDIPPKYSTSDEVSLSPHNIPARLTEESLAERQELRDLKALFEAKISGLETEVDTTKRSLKNALQENEELKRDLNKKEDELHASFTNNMRQMKTGDVEKSYQVNAPIIERLTSERDELLKSVTQLRGSVADSQQREANLRKELQKSLSALEEIQLQKSQVMIEKDQFKTDYQNIQEKYQVEISEGHKRTLDAVTQQRLACMKDLTDLERKVGELMASCKLYEDELEKSSKEKSSILLQLEESRSQLLQTEKDLSAVTAEVKHEVKSALRGYAGAEKELRDARYKVEQELLKVNQERARYQEESLQAHSRLQASEGQVLSLQEMNVTLTQQLNDVRRKAEKLYQDNSRLEKKRSDELKILQISANEEVAALTDNLKRTEIEYEQRLADLETICAKQSNIIPQLKDECAQLDNALAQLAAKYKTEVGKRAQTIEQMTVKVDRLQYRNEELSRQCVNHGKTHRAMEERIMTLKERSNASNDQVLHLLDLHANFTNTRNS